MSYNSRYGLGLAFFAPLLFAAGCAGPEELTDEPATGDSMAQMDLDVNGLVAERMYAQQLGIDLTEATRRLHLQEEISGLGDRLEKASDGRFAGGWIEHTPDYHFVVRLTGDAPAPGALERVAKQSPVPVRVRLGATATLAQLVAAVEQLTPMLLSAIPSLNGTDVDVKTGDIVLDLGPDSPSDDQVMRSLPAAGITLEQPLDAGAVPQEIRVKLPVAGITLGQPLRIKRSEGRYGNQHTYGGAKLSTCTTGFTVKNGSGTKGVLTSAHCDDPQTYYEADGTSYALTFKAAKEDADEDYQWHTNAVHAVYSKFYVDGSGLRGVTGTKSRANQNVGDWVCHYGKVSLLSCATISSKTFSPGKICKGATCASTWIKVEGSGLACAGGDSGGPWFYNSTAYGIHKSGASTGPDVGQCSSASFMAIDYISGLGLTVLTE
jgi:hypothetical protein